MIRTLISPKFSILSLRGCKYGIFTYGHIMPKQIACRSSTTAPNTAVSLTRAGDIDKRDHYSLHWTMDKVLSAALVAIFPASYFIVHPAMDYLLATSLVLHSHWGMEVVLGDYVDRWDRYNRYNFFAPLANVSLLLISAAMLGSLCYFNYSDVGIREAIRLIWHEV